MELEVVEAERMELQSKGQSEDFVILEGHKIIGKLQNTRLV